LVLSEATVPGSLKEICKLVVPVFKHIFVFCSILFWVSCNTKQDVHSESVKIDSVVVLCDPSWESILRTFITTYEGLNRNKKIILFVKPETECVSDLLNDRYRTVFVSRDLTTQEKEVMKKKQWRIKNDTLCYDGLTWIAPISFPKDSLTIDEIKELFQTGTYNGNSYSIQLNSSGSSVANYLTNFFGMPPSTAHLYIGGSDEAILKSVKAHSNALACISSGWLVNLEDKKHRDYLSSIKVLKISKSAHDLAYSSFQNDLALGKYPFKRTLLVLNHDAPTGSGTAFASFLIGNRGQRVFLKAGLLPYKMPAREVEFTKQ
jgi:phosphate transport system substrate-binding protein